MLPCLYSNLQIWSKSRSVLFRLGFAEYPCLLVLSAAQEIEEDIDQTFYKLNRLITENILHVKGKCLLILPSFSFIYQIKQILSHLHQFGYIWPRVGQRPGQQQKQLMRVQVLLQSQKYKEHSQYKETHEDLQTKRNKVHISNCLIKCYTRVLYGIRDKVLDYRHRHL